MTQLHMDTETVRMVASRMNSVGEEMLHLLHLLRASDNQLDWISTSRYAFDANLNEIIAGLQARIDHVQRLALRAVWEADEWERIDSRYAGEMSSMKAAIGAAAAAAAFIGGRKPSDLPLSARFHVSEIPPLNYALFSSLAYSHSPTLPDSLKQAGWEFLGDADDFGVKGEGYAGAAFFNPRTGELVIAHRGTDQWNFNPLNGKSSDVDDDINIGLGRIPGQYEVSRQFVEKVKQAVGQRPDGQGYTLVHTGHSLGVALSDLNALTDNSKGIGFDNPGTHKIVGNHQDIFNPDNRSNLISYQSNPNLVNHVDSPTGYSVQIIPQQGTTSSISVVQFLHTAQHHSLDNIIASISPETGFPAGYFPPGTGGANHGSYNLDQYTSGGVNGAYGAPACFQPPPLTPL